MTDNGAHYVTVDNPNLGVSKGGAGWLWGILALIAIIAAVVFLILWLVQRNKKNDILSVTNQKFSINSSNQMTATWSSSNASDVVNLYVIQSGGKLNFTSDGTPTNSSIIVARSGQVAASVGVATATPVLTLGVSYIGYLVVTNSTINDYKSYKSQVLIVGNFGPTGAFHIKAVSQQGEIVYATPENMGETGATGSVGYNFSDTTAFGDNLFFYDSNQNICTIPPSAVGIVNNLDLINDNTTCASFGTGSFAPFVLTGENSTLSIKQFDVNSPSDTNAKWIFDSNDKSWCIANTNKSRCMQLGLVKPLNKPVNFTGTISTDDDNNTQGILTVKTGNVNLIPGQIISGTGVVPGTIIVSVKDANTYLVNIPQNVSETNMTAQSFSPISIAPQTDSNQAWININFKL